MITTAELIDLSRAIREDQTHVEDQLVRWIEVEVEEYRAFLVSPRPQLPPAELADRLPLMGWLLLEASLSPLWKIAADFEALPDEQRADSEDRLDLIARIADAARALPWPEFAPRSLGAIRAQALAESKRDTEAGYDSAWILHEEARARYESFHASHAADPDSPYLLALDEVLLQLALAETGTACRTAERVIGLWAEGLGNDESAWTEADSDRWIQRMFGELTEGVKIGERALAVAEQIDDKWGFVRGVDESRLALTTSYRNPGIMTARAALLLFSLTPEMERLGRIPEGSDTWQQCRAQLLTSVENAYRAIERPVHKADGTETGLLASHQRSVMQIRLHCALVAPGHPLPSRLTFAPVLELTVLDDDAVESISTWLAEIENGKERGDANVIGSATMTRFVESVEKCRMEYGVREGYRKWRRRWYVLDRYAGQDGRLDRVEKILGAGD
jgi:hypothetical protein